MARRGWARGGWEPASPQKDLGAKPLNSLNLNCIFMLWHVVVTNQLFSHVIVAYCFLLRIVFCFVVFFLMCVCWCRLVCVRVSPLFLLIVDIFGDFADFAPPLTSEWGTLLWHITLFSVHYYCASRKYYYESDKTVQPKTNVWLFWREGETNEKSPKFFSITFFDQDINGIWMFSFMQLLLQ